MNPSKAIMVKIASYFPYLLAAALILVGGWILARILRLLAIKFLLAIHFDVAAEKAGLDDLFVRGEIRQSPVELVGQLVFWMMMLIIFVAAMNALGLQAASSFLNDMLLYFPRIFVAIFILVLGLFFANFISGVVRVGAANLQRMKADLVGRIARYVIIVIASAMALEELGIASQIVTAAFVILFGSVCFALSLAFGLGCKDLVARFVSQYLEKSQRSKEEIEEEP
ncbi:MAG: hypothetical protein QHH30_09515 [candidate division NC10 bacterium]|nr:hypothetical protein [candidate division NC10 bacterium]